MGIESIKKFTDDLRRLPIVVAQKVAAAVADPLTRLAQETFHDSQTPYGVPWVPGKEGEKVTLVKTGALAERLRYMAIGTKLRVQLGVPYAKYQIGRRPVFPRQGGALPQSYVTLLQRTAVRIVKEELRK